MRNGMMLRAGLYVLLGATVCVCMRAYAQNDTGAATHRIFELTNRDRVAHGLRPCTGMNRWQRRHRPMQSAWRASDLWSTSTRARGT